jgi:DNA-binding response OmpR family regulator/nitrogen-specific signal transduction histidine kinase
MQVFIIIASVLALILLFIAGRFLYERSVRVRNKLQMAQMFTNISHELLTPLTVLSASIERMRMQEPRFEQDYALMDINIERMVRLLQEILETSKSISGELKLSVAQADVMEYIKQTALCLEPLMAKKHISFTVDCNPKSMMGWIDTDKLDKIIYNLLSNAAKYTADGGKVSVVVNTNKKYDHVTIEVRDNGIGIPKEQMKNLYHRFHDGDYRKMQTTGTGIGLSLTRDLIYLHGGTIDYETHEGKGTVFYVTIPINKEAFSASQINESYQVELGKPQKNILDFDKLLASQSKESPIPLADNADDDIYRLLIVEDNLDLLMMMQTLLGQKYHVCTAKNGVEALEKVKTEELDLVISDVMMPEMDGNELTRQLKSNPNTSHLPIILLTAKAQEEDRTESMLLGADDYIVKPFKLGDLDLRIRNIIENRKRIQREFMAKSVEESRQKTEAMMSPDERFLKKAMDCVFAHLTDEDFDRDAFASEMGASASTLYNKLRSVTGMNVTSFIRDIRMKEAKRLAQTQPDLRVSDLAYMVGFKDPKYFSTCFKKEFGMQPSEYLEQIANE